MVPGCWIYAGALAAALSLELSTVSPAGERPHALLPGCRLSEFKVAIDIGHTRLKPGATSARGDTELSFNQRFARVLVEALTETGFAPPLLLNSGGDLSLEDRTRAANRAGASFFISIHHDSVQPRYLSTWIYQGRSRAYSDRFQGYSLFVSSRNRKAELSVELGRLIGQNLRQRGFAPTMHHAENIPGENRKLIDPDSGLYEYDDLVVLRTAEMPAVLLEAGVVVNRAEELLLRDAVRAQSMARAVAEGLSAGCIGGTRPAAAWSDIPDPRR